MGDAAALAVQVAALRGQVRLIFARLDMAGITGDINLADQFAELARAVTQAPTARHAAPLPLTGSASTPPTTPASSRNSGSGPTPSCAANTAEWHRTYSRNRPDLDRVHVHGRWLPGIMRRIGDITRRRNPECAARRQAPKAAHGLTPFAQQPPPASGKDPPHDHRQAHFG